MRQPRILFDLGVDQLPDTDFELDPRSLANFVLDYAEAADFKLTNLSLQKHLYYCHGWTLATYGRPLVNVEFEAWSFGPVSRLVYFQFNKFRRAPISERAFYLSPLGARLNLVGYSLSRPMVAFLQHIINEYKIYSPIQLSNLTHEFGSPWHETWTRGEVEAIPQMRIKNSEILAYFQRLRIAHSA